MTVPVVWDYPEPKRRRWTWLDDIVFLLFLAIFAAGAVVRSYPQPPKIIPPAITAPNDVGQMCRGDGYLVFREEPCWDGEVVVSPRVDR